jgi:hypothetical protein
VHPTAQKKLDARIKALGDAAQLPPGFDDLPIFDRIKWLDSKLSEQKKTLPAEADKGERPAKLAAPAAKKLLAKYPKAKLAQLARYFTNFRSNEDEERSQTEIEENLVQALSWYELFEKEGGFDEAARLDVGLGIPVDAAVSDLRDAKKLDAAFKTTDGMTPESAQQQQRAFVQKLLDACRNDIAHIVIPDVKSQLQSQLQAGSDAAGNRNFDRAQMLLEPLQRRVQTQLADEAGRTKAAREAWTKFEAEYKKAPDGAGLKAFREKYAEELKGIEPLIAAAKFKEAANIVKSLTNEMDRAINGANSKIAQMEKAHAEAIDLVKGISSVAQVASALKLAAEYRDGGDLEQCWGQVALLQSHAADAALKPVRDLLETKKPTNKDACAAFSIKHMNYLDAGLPTRLAENKVNINTLLTSVPALITEVQAIT